MKALLQYTKPIIFHITTRVNYSLTIKVRLGQKKIWLKFKNAQCPKLHRKWGLEPEFQLFWLKTGFSRAKTILNGS